MNNVRTSARWLIRTRTSVYLYVCHDSLTCVVRFTCTVAHCSSFFDWYCMVRESFQKKTRDGSWVISKLFVSPFKKRHVYRGSLSLFFWWILQHCTGFARLVWGRLRVHRAFIYSDWFVCCVCFCSLLPRLTLLLSFFGHSALPPPRGGSASRVSLQSCQSHESLWGSWYSRLLCSE